MPKYPNQKSKSTDVNSVPICKSLIEQDAVFIGSDCIDSDFDALSAL